VQKLQERGYKDVWALQGGFHAWQEAGLLVESNRAAALEPIVESIAVGERDAKMHCGSMYRAWEQPTPVPTRLVGSPLI
jgi:3-mercaptopyruvate sulfurtransferase SseA